jgi:acyl transferase domain-containing protein
VAAYWGDRGRRLRHLRGAHAFHSPAMDAVLPDFEKAVRELRLSAPRLPVTSNLTGGVADRLDSPEYWVRHVRRTVRFADGVRHLSERGVSAFYEISPAPVLLPMVGECVPAPVPALLVPMGGLDDEHASLLAGVAAMGAGGRPVHWGDIAPPARHVDLPAYPFQREPYWIDADLATAAPPAEAAADPQTPHLRLGELVPDEREAELLHLIRTRAAAILGHPSAEAIRPGDDFLDAGFSSLTALELRNQICALTGLTIPPSILYDASTPIDLTRYLNDQFTLRSAT